MSKEAAKVVKHRVHARVAARRVGRRCPGADGGEIGVAAWRKFPQGHAKGVLVACLRRLAAVQQFRRHVAARASAWEGRACRDRSKPEIAELRHAVLADEDVGRLHVAVDHAAMVGVGKRLGDLDAKTGDIFG